MPAHNYIRTRGVKWDKELECFTMWCPSCEIKGNTATFWPLTVEFWDIHKGLVRCRACNTELKRAEEKGRRAVKREEISAKYKAYYGANRELLRWKQNQRRQKTAATKNRVPA